MNQTIPVSGPGPRWRGLMIGGIVMAVALLAGLGVLLGTWAARYSSQIGTTNEPDSPQADANPQQMDPKVEAATARTKGVDLDACPYTFSARVKLTSGTVYRLSKVQTLSRFPFPQAVKESFGRLLVMAAAPTHDAAQTPPAPLRHFWFSKLRHLRNVGQRLEIMTTSGRTFVSEQGWLSNYRHKRYPYEGQGTEHDVVMGLTDAGPIGIDTVDIEEIEFTTDEGELRRFETDLEGLWLPRRPAVFRFEKRSVAAERFFFLDGAGEWYKTIFFHPGWPGGPDFTIWHDTGGGTANYWELPQVPVVMSEVKSIEFGPLPDLIRTKVLLTTGAALSGYFVTHTESQRGVWQWELGQQGFWDSVILVTDDGLDVYAMFPGGPHFAELARDVGRLCCITFDLEQTEKAPK